MRSPTPLVPLELRGYMYSCTALHQRSVLHVRVWHDAQVAQGASRSRHHARTAYRLYGLSTVQSSLVNAPNAEVRSGNYRQAERCADCPGARSECASSQAGTWQGPTTH